MTLSPREAETFVEIVERVGDPEVRHDRFRLALAAVAVVGAFSMLMQLLGWGWAPVMAFSATFLPGMAATSVVLHRMQARRARRGG